jgi:hypothetical protein
MAEHVFSNEIETLTSTLTSTETAAAEVRAMMEAKVEKNCIGKGLYLVLKN